jgi:hypothetical protein
MASKFFTNKRVVRSINKDIRPIRLERTSKNTGSVHLEDGGRIDFKVDDPRKFELFQRTPKSIGGPKTCRPTAVFDPRTNSWKSLI